MSTEKIVLLFRRAFPSFAAWAGNLGWPILQLQLRADLRKNRFFVVQLACLGILGVGLLTLIVAQVEHRTSTPTQIGQYIFSLFFCLQYLIILLVFPAFSSTAFSEERVAGTMDLLVTTVLRPAEIVWGKFFASSVYCLLYVLASIPLLSIAFLFGGVKLSEVLIAYVILVGLTLLISMFGVCLSSLFAGNLRSTLAVYAAMAVLLVASLGLYGELRPGVEANRSVIAALLAYCGMEGVAGTPRVAACLLAAATLFAYLFLITANRVRPWSHNRSSPLRILTFLTIPGFLAFAAVGVLFTRGSLAGSRPAGRILAAAAGEEFARVILAAGVLLLLAALVFATESPRIPRRSRERFQRLRGLSSFARIFAPGAFWGVIYCAVLSLLACGGLFLAWKLSSAGTALAGSQLEFRVEQALLVIPPYVLAFAAFGSLVAACGFTPNYARSTVFFIFLITALLPVIFMVSETPDSIWTFYYISPVTIWSSLGEIPADRPPQFVSWGLPVVRVAQVFFSVVAVGLFAAGLAVRKKKVTDGDFPSRA